MIQVTGKTTAQKKPFRQSPEDAALEALDKELEQRGYKSIPIQPSRPTRRKRSGFSLEQQRKLT